MCRVESEGGGGTQEQVSGDSGYIVTEDTPQRKKKRENRSDSLGQDAL